MPDEKPAPLPLTGQEVRDAVLFKLAESMSKSCHLRVDDAYSSFKAEISVKLTLSDYGREVADNHIVKTEEDTSVEPAAEPLTHEANVTLEPMPPNKVRIDTQQKIPVYVTEKGRKVVRHLDYAPRKAKSEKSKIGQDKE